MVIILFLLLVAVWAAVMLPSALNARRDVRMTTSRQDPPLVQTGAGAQADENRRKVLARRRFALIALGAGALISLVAAVVTGSLPLLIVTLVFDVLLAVYIAILLQVKQRRGTGGGPGVPYQDTGEAPEARVVGG